MKLIVLILLGAILTGCAEQSASSSKPEDHTPYRPMETGPMYQPGHPMLP